MSAATDVLVARWHSRNGRQWVECYRMDDGNYWTATNERSRPMPLGDRGGDVYAIDWCEERMVPYVITGKAYRDVIEVTT